MTINKQLFYSPKLRDKDGYCLLSYFDGYDSFLSSSSYGNYSNTGSLGDISDLKLNTDVLSLRQSSKGIGAISVPTMQPPIFGHGLATNDCSYGEGNTITFEGWVKQNYINGSAFQFIFLKRYNTNPSNAWLSPYTFIGLGSDGSSCDFAMYYAISGGFSKISSGFSFPLTKWVHIGMTWTNGGDIKLYMNGVNIKIVNSKTMYYGNHGGWSVGGRGGIGDSLTGLGAEGFFGVLSGIRLHSVIRPDDWFYETYRMGVSK